MAEKPTSLELEDWPEGLKNACRERCAEMGEPACWEVDEWINPHDPDRGQVCEKCLAWRDNPGVKGGALGLV